MRLIPKRHLLILILLIPFWGFIPQAVAQDTQKQKNEKEFNEFQSKITSDFIGFLSKNDSIFLRFLETSWKEFNLFKEDVTVRIKPAEQPFVDSLHVNTEEPPVKRTIQVKQPIEQSIPDKPAETHPEDSKETASPVGMSANTYGVDFFGQKADLPVSYDLPSARTITNAEIISYYKSYMANKAMAGNVGPIFQFAQERSLNDWGYLYLVILASEKYYPEMYNRVLFVWMTLLKHGFDVKIGHDAKNIYLLVNFQDKIFNKQYVIIASQRYYVYTFPNQHEPQSEISSYETLYSQAVKPVSLIIPELPGLTGHITVRDVFVGHDTFPLALTLPLIEFMNAYPDCELSVYFTAPASERAMKSMDKLLLPILIGKTETEKVAVILNFVQKSIPYKVDEAQFGKENYLFADETLYYPFSDCEDRAILLSKLVERYTGLKTIGLDYPEHVSLGVNFTKPMQGDYIIFNTEKYYICDPTYIGAKIGMAMGFMKDQNPRIILTIPKN
ncbi:MAG: hypothetical protein WCJ26_11795 [bacterium]